MTPFYPIYPLVKYNSTRLSHNDPLLAWLHLNLELWGAVYGISWSPIPQRTQFAPVTMPAYPTHTLAVQGRGGNPRYVIQNHLEGLPEVGDSSIIRGDAPASAKRLVKNVFDAYGVGTEECFASSVGESVRLVEVNAKEHHQRPDHLGPKERLEASTVAEVTISPGTSQWVIRPHFPHAYGHGRDAQRSRNSTWRMYCLSDRHVRSTCQSLLGNDRGLRFDSCCSTPLVVLGHVQGKNGLGVTQNININYHAPVPL